jgi:hypothetical protein
MVMGSSNTPYFFLLGMIAVGFNEAFGSDLWNWSVRHISSLFT